jgi:hypothetical protein
MSDEYLLPWELEGNCNIRRKLKDNSIFVKANYNVVDFNWEICLQTSPISYNYNIVLSWHLGSLQDNLDRTDFELSKWGHKLIKPDEIERFQKLKVLI